MMWNCWNARRTEVRARNQTELLRSELLDQLIDSQRHDREWDLTAANSMFGRDNRSLNSRRTDNNRAFASVAARFERCDDRRRDLRHRDVLGPVADR